MDGDEQTYRTFIRTANSWRTFANNPKQEQETGLSWAEAAEACREYNENRSEAEKEAGTMMEFERE